jgi:hypothetical protein
MISSAGAANGEFYARPSYSYHKDEHIFEDLKDQHPSHVQVFGNGCNVPNQYDVSRKRRKDDH